jgi:hypothetical protein
MQQRHALAKVIFVEILINNLVDFLYDRFKVRPMAWIAAIILGIILTFISVVEWRLFLIK